jgi:hypothetical protein
MSKLENLCGLVMSVNAIKKVLVSELKELNITYPISNEIAIQLTAVIEYLVAEILELAGNVTRDKRRTRITDEFVVIAIQNDDELNEVYNHTGNVHLNKPTDETPKLSTWTTKVMRQVHPDTNICADTRRFVDKLVYDTIKRFAEKFPQDGKDIDIRNMIDNVLTLNLAKHAKSEANKAIVKYNSKE